MPWWSWILIWSALLLGLAAMLAWFAYRIFRKLMTAMKALEELGSQVAGLNPGDAEAAPDRFRTAIFRDRHELEQAVAVAQAARDRRRQLRRDRLIARSKLFAQASLIQRTDPHA
ncbi:MAG TPA: hypothetical protein VFC59_09750 [Cryobacterium sp.]|nr:hypothetical protein [Cryobacterium sp.]